MPLKQGTIFWLYEETSLGFVVYVQRYQAKIFAPYSLTDTELSVPTV